MTEVSTASLVSSMPAAASGWQASLELAFERSGEKTRLASNRHVGPLRLIRALDGPNGCCEAVIVHPPGGLVGGDRLALDLSVGEGAHVLCTTPGAQKWYRSLGEEARADTRLQVGPAAVVEWLPQPAIVFDRAHAHQSVEFDLAQDARMIGWECLVLGRAAMGERFLRGSLRQRLALRIGGRPIWSEQAWAMAGDRLFDSPLGWSGRTVAATVWAVGSVGAVFGDSASDTDEGLLAAWRRAIDGFRQCDPRFDGGASCLDGRLLVARLLADDSEAVMAAAQALWRLARPPVLGLVPAAPRIWAT